MSFKLISGTGKNTSYLQGTTSNKNLIEDLFTYDKDIDGVASTDFFINKNITDENLNSLTVDEIVYAIVQGDMQVVFQDIDTVFIKLIKNINKPVKGTSTKIKQIGSNVSIGKMIK